MNVTVKLHGALGRASKRPADGAFDFTLPDGATTGDLLARLADRFGEPFCEAAKGPSLKLPSSVRMFVEGQLVLTREQPLAERGVEAQKVIVMLISPLTGGR